MALLEIELVSARSVSPIWHRASQRDCRDWHRRWHQRRHNLPHRARHWPSHNAVRDRARQRAATWHASGQIQILERPNWRICVEPHALKSLLRPARNRRKATDGSASELLTLIVTAAA